MFVFLHIPLTLSPLTLFNIFLLCSLSSFYTIFPLHSIFPLSFPLYLPPLFPTLSSPSLSHTIFPLSFHTIFPLLSIFFPFSHYSSSRHSFNISHLHGSSLFLFKSSKDLSLPLLSIFLLISFFNIPHCFLTIPPQLEVRRQWEEAYEKQAEFRREEQKELQRLKQELPFKVMSEGSDE